MKNIFITGVTKGIGKALAQKYLSEGCFVVGTVYGDNFDLKHINLRVFPLDISSSDSIHRCVHEIEQLNIKFDIHINNAAILLDSHNTIIDIDILRRTLEVNLIGTINITELMLPHLEKNAHIVNISSSAGCLEDSEREDDDEHPAYKISKTALNMYTRTLAVRLSKDLRNIIVSSVHPGWVQTDMGGIKADLDVREVANDIFEFSQTKPPTGDFWHKGVRMPW